MTMLGTGLGALCRACYAGDDDTVQHILHSGKVDVNARYSGNTPLLWAVQGNQYSVVRTLLSNPDTLLSMTTASGMTCVHLACLGVRSSLIPLLGQDRRCSQGILNRRNRCGDTALMLAVQTGNLECVKELDNLEWTNFRTQNTEGETLVDVARKLMIKKMPEGAEMLEYLIQRNRKVETLAEIAAYNVAKYIGNETDVEQLEIPKCLHRLVTKFFDK